jgi:hypothetical protein
VVGQFYQLSFWANADTANSFSATENGLSVNGIANTIAQNGFPNSNNSSLFTDYIGTFTATSTTTDLVFTAEGDPPLGSSYGSVMIDGVSVVATPEPGSIVLLLTGIMALGLVIGRNRRSNRICRFSAGRVLSVLALGAVAAGVAASAQSVFTAGNLVVSRSVYAGTAGSVTIGETLPPNCVPSVPNGVTCGNAVANGSYPFVFNNDTADGSFGITSPIYLDQLTPGGVLINSIELPNSLTNSSAFKPANSHTNTIVLAKDQLVTSFSSKSEEALHLSTDGKYLTLIDYVAAVNTVDVSNANTPLVIDPTNPVPGAYYRAVATINAQGQFTFTETNAYSGNNGRAAIYVDTNGDNFFYTAGNAGNGANPQPQGVVEGAGAQIVQALNEPEAEQDPGAPTPVASFAVTELGDAADKVGKDDNFRGITLYNNVLYLTKGSGSNGVNTVYFVDTTGTACPAKSTTPGVGLPVPGAPLPTTILGYSAKTGLTNNMCVLAGFPVLIAKSKSGVTYPFGLWFANATTLYVADEGDGTNTYSAQTGTYTEAASAANPGGLQKWIFNSTTNTWQLAYTLKTGLKLGTPYTVAGYPTGNNDGTDGTGLPWAPATDGLRNIIGTVEGNRIQGYYAVIWATSSTVSGNGDEGADPNKLYLISDKLTNASSAVAAEETFTDLRDAQYGEVLRGVSFTPGTAVASY